VGGLDGRTWGEGGSRRPLLRTRQGPLPLFSWSLTGEGPEGLLPVTMVWPTSLSVEDYVRGGREVLVPRLVCPDCGEVMTFWGWYERYLRAHGLGSECEVVVRRERCRPCARSHAVLPNFVTKGRLDSAEVIGPALEETQEHGVRPTARRTGVPHTTLRGWLRRFEARAEMLAVVFSRFCVAWGDLAPRIAESGVPGAFAAARAAWATARRRLGEGAGALWRFANSVVGAELLTTNTDLPSTAS
jgi:hypothetical protein